MKKVPVNKILPEVKQLSASAVFLKEGNGVRFIARSYRLWYDFAGPLIVMAGVLFFWEFACKFFSVREFIVPAPSVVLKVLLEQGASLAADTFITGGEALGGFLLSNIISIALAISFCFFPWLERAVYPYMIALKSVPVVAFAPLLVLWIGYGPESKVAMAAIIAFFPMVVNSAVGLKAVEHDQIELFRAYSATQVQILFKLRIPTAIPYIFAALKVSSALAVVGAIVAELSGAKRGIGFAIMMASYNIDTPLLFASIFCASILGLGFFLFIVGFEKVVGSKYKLDS